MPTGSVKVNFSSPELLQKAIAHRVRSSNLTFVVEDRQVVCLLIRLSVWWSNPCGRVWEKTERNTSQCDQETKQCEYATARYKRLQLFASPWPLGDILSSKCEVINISLPFYSSVQPKDLLQHRLCGKHWKFYYRKVCCRGPFTEAFVFC